MAADPSLVLQEHPVVAVVGFSTNPRKEAHSVPMTLHRRGFTVIGVHPSATEINGLPVHQSLADIPDPVDLVVVFRPSAEAAGVVQQAADIGARAVWLQQGITSAEAARIADEAGMAYVEDECSAVVASVFDVRHGTG